MAVVIPKRSYLAFQRPADKSAYGWRNSQPLRFGKNDTGHQWNEFYEPSEYPLNSQYYFCKDTISNEKMYVESLENYSDNGIMAENMLEAVQVNFTNGSNNIYFGAKGSNLINSSIIFRPGSDYAYWHRWLFDISFKGSYTFDELSQFDNYIYTGFGLTFKNNTEINELLNVLFQGVSYNEIYITKHAGAITFPSPITGVTNVFYQEPVLEQGMIFGITTNESRNSSFTPAEVLYDPSASQTTGLLGYGTLFYI